MARLVCWFSCGAASAVATKLALTSDSLPDGVDEIAVVNCEVKEEHEDNRRFLADCEKWFGVPITVLGNDKYDRSAHKVFRDTRFLVGPSGARCTGELKRALRHEHQRPDDVILMGFTADEKHRHDRFAKSEWPMRTWPVLIERDLHKADCHAILHAAGIREPEMYRLGYANANCFTGDTRYITPDGIKTLKEMAGGRVTILNREGWQTASISSFGHQEVWNLVLKNGPRTKAITTTAGHGWIVPRYKNQSQGVMEKETCRLKAGDRPLVCFAETFPELSRAGVQHGFVFGDGSLTNGGRQSRAYIAECKAEILAWFDRKMTKSRYIHGLPAHFKNLPQNPTPEYSAGFLAGLIASDGCVSKSGIEISNKSRAAIDAVKEVAQSLGLVAWAGATKTRDTNYKKDATLSSLILPRSVVPNKMILREFHKERMQGANTRPKAWEVVSVAPAGRIEEVFCATVDGASEFTLEDSILTKNCVGCVKGGAGYWNKVRVDFPDTFAEMAKIERELGRQICKREWTEGGKRKLERVYLDELPPDLGSYREDAPAECGLFCQLAMADIDSTSRPLPTATRCT